MGVQFAGYAARRRTGVCQLIHPFSSRLIKVFAPFKQMTPRLKRGLLRRILILSGEAGIPVLSVRPFNRRKCSCTIGVQAVGITSRSSLREVINCRVHGFGTYEGYLGYRSLYQTKTVSVIKSDCCVGPSGYIHYGVYMAPGCLSNNYVVTGCLEAGWLRTEWDCNCRV